METVIQILSIAGALGVFLFGMKLLSEASQKLVGKRMRNIIATMTSNRIIGVFTGIFITALIQSSSATTVMIVSFVNSGLMTLIESIGVIMGANIGTTFTAWLISIFGFKLNVGFLLLPIIGLSIPLLFSKKRKPRNWGETITGFALLFIGLSFLKDHLPAIDETTHISDFIDRISSYGYLSYIIFLLMGSLLTVVIQSSSAMFALTLVMCVNGWMEFDMAAAMVLGENVGTTISTNIAARAANTTAKRAALVHFIFNVFGALWVLPFLPFLLKEVSLFFQHFGGGDPFKLYKSIPLALVLFHTLFNVINAILLIGFAGLIAKIVTKFVPSRADDDTYKLKHIKIGLLSTPDASIFQARREATVYADRIRRMFHNVVSLYKEKNETQYKAILQKIQETEEIADQIEIEIANYLTKVGEGRLSGLSSSRLRALYKIIDEIESIADTCINLVNAIERKNELKIVYNEHIDNNLMVMFGMVKDALDITVTMLTHEKELQLSEALKQEEEINNFRNILKIEHLDNLEKGVYNYDAGILYNDIFSQCERLADYAINIDEAVKSLANE